MHWVNPNSMPVYKYTQTWKGRTLSISPVSFIKNPQTPDKRRKIRNEKKKLFLNNTNYELVVISHSLWFTDYLALH